MAIFDYSALQARMCEEGVSVPELAIELEISPETLGLKFKNKVPFCADEMVQIAKRLDNSADNICAYFFTPCSGDDKAAVFVAQIEDVQTALQSMRRIVSANDQLAIELDKYLQHLDTDTMNIHKLINCLEKAKSTSMLISELDAIKKQGPGDRMP